MLCEQFPTIARSSKHNHIQRELYMQYSKDTNIWSTIINFIKAYLSRRFTTLVLHRTVQNSQKALLFCLQSHISRQSSKMAATWVVLMGRCLCRFLLVGQTACDHWCKDRSVTWSPELEISNQKSTYFVFTFLWIVSVLNCSFQSRSSKDHLVLIPSVI